MHESLIGAGGPLAVGLSDALYNTVTFLKVLIGFSIIIFIHELGHFLAAKWVGVRVDRFAVGFGTRLFGWRKGEGFTFGTRPDYTPEELGRRSFGETDYCFKALPLGGYVKMLGQEDIIYNEETGEMTLSDDPRAFTSRPVGQRMIVVSAGVIFNLLFAAVVFMLVFLMGKPTDSPVVGEVPRESPAAGKLESGDRVLAVNGRAIGSYKEIMVETVLSSGPVTLDVERNGKPLPQPITIEPTIVPGTNLRTIGVGPMWTTEALADGEQVDDLPNLKAGDVVLSVDGTPVSTGPEVVTEIAKSRGRVVKMTVRRPNPEDPNAPPIEETVYQQGIFMLEPPAPFTDDVMAALDQSNVLGLTPRRMISAPQAGWPAAKAGFRDRDVIARWGQIPNPTFQEIKQTILENPRSDIPVVVRRGDELIDLKVRPKRPFQLFGTSEPKVGLSFVRPEESRPVVAYVMPDSLAASANIPRGALITHLDDKPVKSWSDVFNYLIDHAGKTVALRYELGDTSVTTPLPVPSSVYDALGLGPVSEILAINGETQIDWKGPGGASQTLRLPASWAVEALLKKHVGKQVRIKYTQTPDAEPQEATFDVTAGNTDPWQMRVRYVYNPGLFKVARYVQRTSSPLMALWLGGKSVYTQVEEAYAVLTHVFITRNVGVENVSGPVGIFGAAIEQAKAGLPELLYFLAFLSVNLAVINFLPLPVLDGGLMMFLLIEKVRGSPLSLKAQMIGTLVGLAVIVLFGLYVTINDITRLFQ